MTSFAHDRACECLLLTSAAGSAARRRDATRSEDAATAYPANPTQWLAEMPACNAMTTANTDPRTDMAPFTPQSHGVRAPAESALASFMPMGNAVPMKNPRVKRITLAR